MHATSALEFPTRGELLAEALYDVIADLRLVEVDHFVAYIRAAQWANISDLIQSSAELFFAEGTLSFACVGDFEMHWCKPPSVSLDLEFQHAEVSVFFSVTLDQNGGKVAIRDIWFASLPIDHLAGTKILAAALRGARLTGA